MGQASTNCGWGRIQAAWAALAWKDGILHHRRGVYMDRVLGSTWRRIAHPGMHYRQGMCPKVQQAGAALL